MTYRCIQCVYADQINENTGEMKCLKHDETIYPTDKRCDDLILVPVHLLSYINYARNYPLVKENRYGWDDADRAAVRDLKEYGFAGMTFEKEDKCFLDKIGEIVSEEISELLEGILHEFVFLDGLYCTDREDIVDKMNTIEEKCCMANKCGAIIEDCEVDTPSDDNQSISKYYIMKSKGSNYFPY